MNVKLKVKLRIFKNTSNDGGSISYTITGQGFLGDMLNGFYTKVNILDDGYNDFQDIIERAIDCDGIELDSESMQFWAYTNSYQRAIRFRKEVKEFFAKVIETEDYLTNKE
jgi:hypothetical protein